MSERIKKLKHKHKYPDVTDILDDESFFLVFKDDEKVSLKARDNIDGYYGWPTVWITEMYI